MNFFDVGRGRRFAGSDRPNRFIGNHGVGSIGIFRNRAHNLSGTNVDGFALFALLFGFADANDRFQTGFVSGGCLFGNQFVGFKMVGSAFGMAEDDISASEIFEHQRADIAGMGTFNRKMSVLCAQRDFGAAKRLFYLIQQRKRRAYQKFAGRFSHFLYTGGNRFGKGNSVFGETVHFPVAGNHNFSSHYFFLKCLRCRKINILKKTFQH